MCAVTLNVFLLVTEVVKYFFKKHNINTHSYMLSMRTMHIRSFS